MIGNMEPRRKFARVGKARIVTGLQRHGHAALLRWPWTFPFGSGLVPGERYFCQNSGSCGSKYIARLFEVNGLGPAYHEKSPDLDVFGIDYFEGRIPDRRAKAVLLRTRRNVFFEANNRLFAMSPVIQEAFPDVRFIHLHRDPRDYLPSSLSKPPSLTWQSGRRRYASEKLAGPRSASPLERACHYWTNYNRRIRDDLKGCEYLSLKSTDLFAGEVDSLERFIGRELQIRKLPPVNADKPVRDEGPFAPFHAWDVEDKAVVYRICGTLMAELGYAVDTPVLGDVVGEAEKRISR